MVTVTVTDDGITVIRVFPEHVLSRKLITFLYFPEKSFCFVLFLSEKGDLPVNAYVNFTIADRKK